MDRDALEGFLAEGLSLAAIGRRVGRHESTVAYWCEGYGLRAVNAERHAARGGLTRQQLEPRVEAGMTIAEIAAELGRSEATVRHWLSRYRLKTVNRKGRRMDPALKQARQDGLVELVRACPVHGETHYVLDGRGYFRCRRCRAESVTRRRRKMKAVLVAEAGGCCRLCGYAATMGALHFHHLDPTQKLFEVNARGAAFALDTLRAEARKCVLLCSNCHAEVEGRHRRDPTYRLDLGDT